MTEDYDDPDDYDDDYDDHEEVQDERGSRPLSSVGEATPALMTLAIKRISTALQHAEEPTIIAKLTDSLMRAMDAYHRYGGEAMERSASGAGGSVTGKLLVIKRLPTRGSVGRLQLLCDGVGTLLDPEVEMVEQDRERLAKVVELVRKADMKGMGESADCRESWAESRDDYGKRPIEGDLVEPPRPTEAEAETKPPAEATEADGAGQIKCSCGKLNAVGRSHCWSCNGPLVGEGRKVSLIWSPAGDESDLEYPYF